jgi:hypothetical protein
MANLVTKFNEQEYEFEMYIDDNTAPSETNRFNINPNSIVNLSIEDTLSDWAVRGTLTIYYAFNIIENIPSESFNTSKNNSYIFRNDGNDTLHVKIFPNLKSLIDNNNANLAVKRTHWELVYKFSIYDVEDIDNPPGAQNAASSTMKCKKFYFWDRWYQQMISDNMEYSTGLSPAALPGGLLSTGNAMKEIIEKSLTKNKVYFDIKNPTAIVGGGDSSAWNLGASNIFYTAPAGTSAYDSLMYVYSRHISTESKYVLGNTTPRSPTALVPGTTTTAASETGAGRFSTPVAGTINDFCILYKERGPKEGDEGYFSLRSMTDFFAKAGKKEIGDYLIEKFSVQNSNNNSSKVVKLNATPKMKGNDLQKGTQLGAYSLISKYKFVDISPITNATKFRSTPVYSFDFRTRTYNIEFSNNSVTTARDFINNKYISNLFSLQGQTDTLSLLTLDASKQSQNVIPVFSLYGEDKLQRQADGLQKLLKIGVFQNTAINFRVLGSTNREPGRFIAIDTEEGNEDTPFNNKFFGQWFVINVKHVFEAGLYYNDITAIKVHRIKSLPLTLQNTI